MEKFEKLPKETFSASLDRLNEEAAQVLDRALNAVGLDLEQVSTWDEEIYGELTSEDGLDLKNRLESLNSLPELERAVAAKEAATIYRQKLLL